MGLEQRSGDFNIGRRDIPGIIETDLIGGEFRLPAIPVHKVLCIKPRRKNVKSDSLSRILENIGDEYSPGIRKLILDMYENIGEEGRMRVSEIIERQMHRFDGLTVGEIDRNNLENEAEKIRKHRKNYLEKIKNINSKRS